MTTQMRPYFISRPDSQGEAGVSRGRRGGRGGRVSLEFEEDCQHTGWMGVSREGNPKSLGAGGKCFRPHMHHCGPCSNLSLLLIRKYKVGTTDARKVAIAAINLNKAANTICTVTTHY